MRRVYICEGCGRRYSSEEAALACEKTHGKEGFYTMRLGLKDWTLTDWYAVRTVSKPAVDTVSGYLETTVKGRPNCSRKALLLLKEAAVVALTKLNEQLRRIDGTE